MPIASPVWQDPKNIDTLTRMWAEGKSGSDIAWAMGITRNMVIGKAHRLKLLPRVARKTTPLVAGKKGRSGNPGVPSVQSIMHRRQGRQRAEDHRVITTIAYRADRAPALPLPPERDEGVDVTHLLGLMDLTTHTCRWPIGDPHDPAFGFCGKPPIEGRPYCEKHDRRAHKPVESK